MIQLDKSLTSQDVPNPVSPRPTVVGIVWIRRLFLFRFILACVILTLIGVLFWPNRYASTVSLMPPSSNASSMLTRMVSGNIGSDAGGLAAQAFGLNGTSKAELYVGMLGSRRVQDAIIDRFDLRNEYHCKYMKDARKKLARYTEVDEDRKSGIITLTVTDRDKNRAAAIAGDYVQQLNKISLEENNTSAHLQRVFLEQRLNQLNSDIKDSEVRLAQFSSKNMTFDSSTQGRAMIEAGADLQAKLISSEAELSGLRQNYAETNSRVMALEATVAELRRQLDAMGSGTKAGQNSGQIYPSLREFPLLAANYEELTRHLKIDAEIAELLNREYEAAKVEEAQELPVVQILDPPNIAETHSSPKRAVMMIASFFIYLAIGVGAVVFEVRFRELEPSDRRKALILESIGYLRQLAPRRRRFPQKG